MRTRVDKLMAALMVLMWLMVAGGAVVVVAFLTRKLI